MPTLAQITSSAGGDDTFAGGSIGKVSVGRNVATSTIGAGLSTTNAILKDSVDTIHGGVASAIAGLIVEGTADNASYFAAEKFGAAPTIGGIKPDLTTDIRFLVS